MSVVLPPGLQLKYHRVARLRLVAMPVLVIPRDGGRRWQGAIQNMTRRIPILLTQRPVVILMPVVSGHSFVVLNLFHVRLQGHFLAQNRRQNIGVDSILPLLMIYGKLESRIHLGFWNLLLVEILLRNVLVMIRHPLPVRCCFLYHPSPRFGHVRLHSVHGVIVCGFRNHAVLNTAIIRHRARVHVHSISSVVRGRAL